MKLWINSEYYISVIEINSKYSCQIMRPIFGIGMIPATIFDISIEDIVYATVSDYFTRTKIKTNTIQEVFDFHKECLLQVL